LLAKIAFFVGQFRRLTDRTDAHRWKPNKQPTVAFFKPKQILLNLVASKSDNSVHICAICEKQLTPIDQFHIHSH